MKIIVGHANMDLDCLASIVLARYLFPDHAPVRSSLVHPSARKLLNLYEDRLGFLMPGDLKGESVERIVVVDTRSLDRIAEHVKGRDLAATEIEIFDHHPPAERDIPGALVHDRDYGANASHLALILKEKGAAVSAEDATVALVGVYSDTGNFTHENTRREDFEAAAWLLERGASLKLVKDLSEPLKERRQLELFHEALNRLERRTIRGYLVQTCYFELDDDALGLGAVMERVFEVENGEILFGFFNFKAKGRLLVIARNSVDAVRLDELLADFGGGGHARAASATVKTESGPELARQILEYLEVALVPAATARELMSADVFTI
ncbi:MAG: DHH family phosphoesterase, partial [Spirochaetaceae bacterium]|nr:DHH family phosphoesterase [Spirochaetaceae bacterium]